MKAWGQNASQLLSGRCSLFHPEYNYVPYSLFDILLLILPKSSSNVHFYFINWPGKISWLLPSSS